MNQYADALRNRIDAIAPGASASLSQIGDLDQDRALAIFDILLTFACQGTNASAIAAGRAAIVKIPKLWLQENLVQQARARLDLDDEWQYRRLLELLQQVLPSATRYFVEIGLSASDIGVREAASEFAGRMG